jgi:O-antigen/teichoic acid export membrane protein
MGIIQRQSLKGLIAFVLGAGVHMVTMLFLMPNMLSEQDIAVYRVYFSLIMLFSVVGLGGTNGIYLKFFSELKTDARKLYMVNTVSLLFALCFCILMVVGIYFSVDIFYGLKKTESPYLLRHFACVPISSICLALLYYFESYSLASHRLTAPTVLKEVALRSMLLLLVVGYYFKWISIFTFFWAYSFSYFICLVVLIVYCVKYKGYRLAWYPPLLKEIPWKKYFSYAFFLFISAVIATAVINMDQVILYGLLGSLATDIYGMAFTIASMITIPYKPLSAILLPFLFDAWQQGDSEKINRINRQSSLYLSAIGILFFLLLNSNISIFYRFIPEYLQHFRWPLLILCLGRILDYATGASTELLLSSPDYKKLNIFFLITFIGTSLMYLFLVPRYSYTGAAVATVFGILLFNSLKFGLLYRKYQLQPLHQHLLFLYGVGGLIFGVQFLLPTLENFYLDAFIRSSLILASYGGIIFGLKLFPEVNDKILALIRFRS